MGLFLKKLSKRIVRDKIKPFAILQIILIIAYLITGFYSLKNNELNYFYEGLSQMIFAVIWLLIGIEQFILKKKLIALLNIIIFVIGIYLAINSFSLLNLRR